MNLSRVKKDFSLFFFISLCIISGCTKIISTDIGSELFPPIDGVRVKEMYMDVFSKNGKDTITRITTTDVHALGYVNDPLFGKTTATINVQLKPSSFPFYFPATADNLFLDSVVLTLSYKGAWGDTSKDLALRVYEITPDIALTDFSSDSAYKSNHVLPKETELTENNIPKIVDINRLSKDTINNVFETSINQVRVRLNPTYGQRLLHFDSSNVYKSDSIFNTAIKGLQVVPEATGNALMKISLTDTNTKLSLYFKYKDTAGKMDTAVRNFYCNQFTSASSNYIQRERVGQVTAFVPPSSLSTCDSLIFIDANPGIYSALKIPGLDTISNKIIYRAELLMEQVPDLSSGSDAYLTPPNLFLTPYSTDSSRRFALPNDAQIQLTGNFYTIVNQTNLGCFPFKKDNHYAYSFDMTRYLQGIVTRKEKTYDFVLFAPFNDFIFAAETSLVPVLTGSSTSPLNFPAVGRVRLGGGNNKQYQMRMHIVYSALP
jgi:hypothetical protein